MLLCRRAFALGQCPRRLRCAFYVRRSIDVNYSDFSAEWNITGKSVVGRSDINANMTYGTERANAYKILEDTLNLRDVRIYDTGWRETP